MMDVILRESFQAGIGKCINPKEPIKNKEVRSTFKGL